jgi:hypothetical protein
MRGRPNYTCFLVLSDSSEHDGHDSNDIVNELLGNGGVAAVETKHVSTISYQVAWSYGNSIYIKENDDGKEGVPLTNANASHSTFYWLRFAWV